MKANGIQNSNSYLEKNHQQSQSVRYMNKVVHWNSIWWSRENIEILSRGIRMANNKISRMDYHMVTTTQVMKKWNLKSQVQSMEDCFQAYWEFLALIIFAIGFILMLQDPQRTKQLFLKLILKFFKRLWITPERQANALNVLKKLV